MPGECLPAQAQAESLQRPAQTFRETGRAEAGRPLLREDRRTSLRTTAEAPSPCPSPPSPALFLPWAASARAWRGSKVSAHRDA